jgi:predicted glycoside hydrolase/deacetylase ChbG (UPF0249 family)
MLDKETRNKLILSADDFGKSELANRNILRLAETGKIDRVSVMSNGNFATGEIERMKISGVKLDIHLDLANIPKKEKKLKKGVLGRGILFLLRHIGSLDYGKSKTRKKWSGQIEKFRELFGRYPDGINSHQHVHLFGRYFSISTELAKRYKISYFRFAKKDFLGTKTNTRKIAYLIWKQSGKKFQVENFQRPDYFASLDWIENIETFLKNIPEGKTEIACHPERGDEFEIINKYF